MKRSIILFALLLPTVALSQVTEDLVVGHFAYRCVLDRADALQRAADVFASYGWQVIHTDPPYGIMRAELVTQERRGAWRITRVHMAAGGDSLRLVVSEAVTGAAGTVPVPITPELANPILMALSRLETTPIKP